MDLPVDFTLLIALFLDLSQQTAPQAVTLPTVKAGTDGLPLAVPFGQIAPSTARAFDPEEAVEDGAVIQRRTARSRSLCRSRSTHNVVPHVILAVS